MSIAGKWTLFFNFGCSGPYFSTSLTVNADGTFDTGDGFKGRWSQTNCQVILRFNGDSAIYAATVNGGAMVGNQVNFSIGASGCHYATRDGGAAAAKGAKAAAAAADAGKEALNSAGKPGKKTKPAK